MLALVLLAMTEPGTSGHPEAVGPSRKSCPGAASLDSSQRWHARCFKLCHLFDLSHPFDRYPGLRYFKALPALQAGSSVRVNIHREHPSRSVLKERPRGRRVPTHRRAKEEVRDERTRVGQSTDWAAREGGWGLGQSLWIERRGRNFLTNLCSPN